MPRIRLDIANSDRADAGESSPGAIRIDTDVFRTFTAPGPSRRGDDPTITRWFDCWRP